MIEAIPLLVIFVVLLSFSLGFFGVIHTATLHSIAARTYAFETFRNRTNLNFFREDASGLDIPLYVGTKGFRFHAVSHESDRATSFVSTERPITLGGLEFTDSSAEVHNTQIFQIQQRNDRLSVNPVWIMVGYGLCLNPACGN